MQINFIIISPEPNIGRLKGTVRSIRNNYSESAGIVCSVEKGVSKDSLNEMREVCDSHRGGSTVASLINKGMEKAREGWNMIVTEGGWVPKNIGKSYGRWALSDKDILYPIGVAHERDGSAKVSVGFADCGLNGILMKKDFFMSVGKFSDNPTHISRLFWALDAMDKGAVFKGVLGVRIC